MELKNIENIHIGNKISQLIKSKNISVYSSLSVSLKKTPAGIYKDFEKADLSVKQVYAYLQCIGINICDFFQQTGICEKEEMPMVLKDNQEEYIVQSEPDIASLKREVHYLNKLLAEKERTIQLLAKGKL